MKREEATLASRAGHDRGTPWCANGACCVEPRLDDLLDDPIMALLWRGDRLEPGAARATVLALRDLLRRRQRGALCTAA